MIINVQTEQSLTIVQSNNDLLTGPPGNPLQVRRPDHRRSDRGGRNFRPGDEPPHQNRLELHVARRLPLRGRPEPPPPPHQVRPEGRDTPHPGTGLGHAAGQFRLHQTVLVLRQDDVQGGHLVLQGPGVQLHAAGVSGRDGPDGNHEEEQQQVRRKARVASKWSNGELVGP